MCGGSARTRWLSSGAERALAVGRGVERVRDVLRGAELKLARRSYCRAVTFLRAAPSRRFACPSRRFRATHASGYCCVGLRLSGVGVLALPQLGFLAAIWWVLGGRHDAAGGAGRERVDEGWLVR